MKSLKKKNLAATALLSLATLTFSVQAEASNNSGNWLSDLLNGLASLVQSIKSHNWDVDWDHDHKKDWDKDWEPDWDKNWSDKWKWDWDDLKKYGHGNGHNGKWFVCHRTGSSKNPYVIIEVSTSGKNAHVAHGDSISFSDKGNGRCGSSSGGSTPDPKITSLSLASSQIAVNTSTTISWASSNATSCKLDNKSVATSGSANVGPYSSKGDRTFKLTCSNSRGSDSETVKLTVVKAPKPSASLSLSTSEIVRYTGTAIASWNSSNATSCKLDGDNVATSGTAKLGPYSSTGTKTISLHCSGPGGTASDSKTLKVKSAPAPAPEVTLKLEPSQIATGAKAKLSWSATNAKSCKLEGSGSLYSQKFSVSIDDSGYYMKGPFYKNGQATYTVTCTGSGGSDSASVTLTVGSSAPPEPTVSLSLDASSIMQNTGATTANWNSTNAQACSLTQGGITTGVALTGTAQVGPFSTSGSQTVTIKCTGASGTTPATASKSLTVTEPPPVPTVTFTLASDEIVVGTGTTLASWSSTDATSCTLGNGSTAGSIPVGPYPVTGLQTLSVTCTGPGGSKTSTVQLNVIDPPLSPTVQICLTSDLTGNDVALWILDYNLDTGEFIGTPMTPEEPMLVGAMTPAPGVSIADAPFAAGTLVDLSAGSLLGLSNGSTFRNGQTGADGYANYGIELYLLSFLEPSLGVTNMLIHGANRCTELGGITPPGR